MKEVVKGTVKKKEIHTYKKKPNGKNATWRPNKRDTPEELRLLIDNYFESISITSPRYEYKEIPVDEKTKYEVIRTFYKLEWVEPDTDDDNDDDGMMEDEETTRRRVRYKEIKMPVLNNLWEQVYQKQWFEDPTVTGLAIYLWVESDTLLNYEGKEEFFGTIRYWKKIIQKYYEERLVRRGNSWDIFAMKNFWWKDKIEVDNTNKNFNGWDLTEEEKKKILDRFDLDEEKPSKS